MPVIIANNLGKAYKHFSRRIWRLLELISLGFVQRHTNHWILRGVSFQIQPGESVGLIGINGAGKSTLLKIIAGVTQPTEGKLQVSGRVSALLELGLGFNADFTGRQNVFMAGQLLGYTLRELQDLMPEIEEFAGLGHYIDQPVRVYSSGMQVRLAFSLATATRPDILIVDEALSVGDIAFQQKSFNRILQFKSLGTTLLVVSHDKEAIQALCSRAILLSKGVVALDGTPESVFDRYNALLADPEGTSVSTSVIQGNKVQTSSGNGMAILQSVLLTDPISAKELKVIKVGQPIAAIVTVLVQENIPTLVLGFGIKDRLGQMVFGANTFYTGQTVGPLNAGQVCTYTVQFKNILAPGHYSVHASLVRSDNHIDCNYHWLDGVCVFEVINENLPQFVGSVWNELTFNCEIQNSRDSNDQALPIN
ncbi:ABC transporter ATP-binding protein [Limnobacter parvus]|uniref:ABC transporter ATP-binding protein n=1 Tax=Limnobacter parvus TaxID=2939690 RepID=A0ABT1XE80_9BURK|nr:ABC transporter ATP-binding protein [Limnobacter parvus]MCR2745231.1 ABC transporter ATP-binding protein [Limnobacter parvus]